MAPQPLQTPIFLLSLCILPFSIYLAIVLSIYVKIRPYYTRNWPLNPSAPRKRVLLTGDDDAAILSTARVLRASGSTVYVIKQERIPRTNSLWTSKAVYRFVGLASGRLTPILRRLTRGTRFTIGMPANMPGTTLNLIENEKIDMWIHCDAQKASIAHMQAKEIVLKHTSVRPFEPDFDTARLARGTGLFGQHLKHYEVEILFPRTVVVRTRTEVHELLWKAPKDQRFLLERSAAPYDLAGAVKANGGTKGHSVAFDDNSTLVDGTSDSDFDGAETATPSEEYTQLPLTTSNHTYSTVASMQISPASPWVMHEVISGRPGSISALVVNGKLKAFSAQTASSPDRTFSTATSRSPWPMKKASSKADRNVRDWQAHEEKTFINPTSTIGIALLRYAERFVATLSDQPSTYLNLHFFLVDRATNTGAEQKIVATGVDFSFSPVVAQQALLCGMQERLGRAMTSASDEDEILQLPISSASFAGTNSKGAPFKLSRSAAAGGESLNAIASSLEELINEQDARYDRNDLVPWIWYWLVQGPVEVVFEGLVESLENAQAKNGRR